MPENLVYQRGRDPLDWQGKINGEGAVKVRNVFQEMSYRHVRHMSEVL